MSTIELTSKVKELKELKRMEVISNRFDTTTFKKTHTDLYEQFTKTTTTRRFTVA